MIHTRKGHKKKKKCNVDVDTTHRLCSQNRTPLPLCPRCITPYTTQACTQHLQEGAHTLHTAKTEGCYLQLLASARARAYFAALLRMHLAVTLLQGVAQHYLNCQDAEIASCATQARMAWDGQGGELRAACFKAALAIQGHPDPAEMEGQALALLDALKHGDMGGGPVQQVCWRSGRCALSLLPCDNAQRGMTACTWAKGRPCLVMLANLYHHTIDPSCAPDLQ